MCMRRTFVSRSIGPLGGVPGQGMRTIIERAFTAHKPATARSVGGWRRLWAAGLLCALAGTASGYVQDLEFERQLHASDARGLARLPAARFNNGVAGFFRAHGLYVVPYTEMAWCQDRAHGVLGPGCYVEFFFQLKGLPPREARRLALRPHRTLAPRTRQQHVRPDTRCHLRGCDCGRRLAQGDRRAHGITQSFAIERLTPPRRVHELTLLPMTSASQM